MIEPTPFEPHMRFPVEFIRATAAGSYANIYLTRRADCFSVGPLGYYGDLLHIECCQPKLVYRLGEYDHETHTVAANWPD